MCFKSSLIDNDGFMRALKCALGKKVRVVTDMEKEEKKLKERLDCSPEAAGVPGCKFYAFNFGAGDASWVESVSQGQMVEVRLSEVGDECPKRLHQAPEHVVVGNVDALSEVLWKIGEGKPIA